jgi:hypothetical protein
MKRPLNDFTNPLRRLVESAAKASHSRLSFHLVHGAI